MKERASIWWFSVIGILTGLKGWLYMTTFQCSLYVEVARMYPLPILTLDITGQQCSWIGQKVSNVYFAMLCTAASCLLIFTGLPKAAVITHLQSLKAAAGFWAFGATEDDVVYIPLPLYHSAASLIGIGGTIELGKSENISTWLILLNSLYIFFYLVRWNLNIEQTTI